MRHTLWWMVVLGWVGCQAAARSDDTYTIKLKSQAEGETLSHQQKLTMELWVQTLDARGKEIETDKVMTMKGTFEFWEKVLERQANKSPSRLRRGFGPARIQGGDISLIFPFEGKMVLIERDKGKFRCRIEGGGDVPDQDAFPLLENLDLGDEALDLDAMYVPRRPMRLNESWAVDTKFLVPTLDKFTKAMVNLDKTKAGRVGIEFDSARTRGIGRLLKVYQAGNYEAGVIKLYIEVPIRSMTVLNQKLAFKDGSKLILESTRDGCIDGSTLAGSTIDSIAHFTGIFTVPDGKNTTGKVVVRNTMKETTKEGPAKKEPKEK